VILLSKKNKTKKFNKIKNYLFIFFVRKSVEEASRSFEKSHRRVTTHLNKSDTLKEEDDDETETESSNNHKQYFNFLLRRRSQRQS
jgi:hypothetical protein